MPFLNIKCFQLLLILKKPTSQSGAIQKVFTNLVKVVIKFFSMFSFSKAKGRLVITKYCKIKLYSGTILHGASNEPEPYSETSQTSRWGVLARTVNSYSFV